MKKKIIRYIFFTFLSLLRRETGLGKSRAITKKIDRSGKTAQKVVRHKRSIRVMV